MYATVEIHSNETRTDHQLRWLLRSRNKKVQSDIYIIITKEKADHVLQCREDKQCFNKLAQVKQRTYKHRVSVEGVINIAKHKKY